MEIQRHLLSNIILISAVSYLTFSACTADFEDTDPDTESETNPEHDTETSQYSDVDTDADTDTDSDTDTDQCPDDDQKIVTGVCGCNVPDTDSDGDGTPDCNDDCASDPNKVAPGICGCNVPETDCAREATNVLAASEGGIIEKCPSAWCPGGGDCEAGYWQCDNINDGAFAKDCKAEDYRAVWSTAKNPTSPQEFIFSFKNGQSVRVENIVIQNFGETPCVSSPYYSSRVKVLGEPAGGGSAFEILDVTLKHDLSQQKFDMVSHYGSQPHIRKLIFRVLSGTRTDWWELGEIEVWGQYAE